MIDARRLRLFPNQQLTVAAADEEHTFTTMGMLSNIVGFSLFGLAARVGQLGIQKRNLFDSKSFSRTLIYCSRTHRSQLITWRVIDPGGHLIAMAVFGYGGYWAWRWDERAAQLIAQKRAEIQARREAKEAVALEA